MWHNSKTQIVIVVIVAVVTVVVKVPLLVKTTWHLDNRCDILRAAFRDSRDVFLARVSLKRAVCSSAGNWKCKSLRKGGGGSGQGAGERGGGFEIKEIFSCKITHLPWYIFSVAFLNTYRHGFCHKHTDTVNVNFYFPG